MRGLRADLRVTPFLYTIGRMKTDLKIMTYKEAINMKEEDKDKALIEEALRVYEIPPQWVFASRVDRQMNAVVIVTHGGKKVIHKAGEKAKCKLTHMEIAGFLPKEELYWSGKLNQVIRLSELVKKN